jgi:hypothetical protein
MAKAYPSSFAIVFFVPFKVANPEEVEWVWQFAANWPNE